MSHYLSLEISVMNTKACIQSNYRVENPQIFQMAIKYWKYLIATFIYEFSTLKSLLMQIFVNTAFLFQNIESLTPFPIFGHDDVILGVKYFKYLKTGSIFEFSTLKLRKMQKFVISALFVEKIGK